MRLLPSLSYSFNYDLYTRYGLLLSKPNLPCFSVDFRRLLGCCDFTTAFDFLNLASFTMLSEIFLPQSIRIDSIFSSIGCVLFVELGGFIGILVSPRFLVPVLTFFKFYSGALFKMLIDLIVYDVPGRKDRFSIIYALLSISYNNRLFLRSQTAESSSLISTVKLFQNSNWLEREVWDMFGIFFFQHPDLRRILTDYGFRGYPLRKNFPLTGYKEIVYSLFTSRIQYLPTSLPQEFREYRFDIFRGEFFSPILKNVGTLFEQNFFLILGLHRNEERGVLLVN